MSCIVLPAGAWKHATLLELRRHVLEVLRFYLETQPDVPQTTPQNFSIVTKNYEHPVATLGTSFGDETHLQVERRHIQARHWMCYQVV